MSSSTSGQAQACAAMPGIIFATALGFAGIAWTDAGLTRLCLPQARREPIAQQLFRHGDVADAQSEPPQWVAEAMASISAYAEGKRTEFDSVPVDLAGMDAFHLAIYAATRALAYGQTTTYGELAKRAGHAGLARETGAALGANPVPLVIPCHRVLAAGGRIGGFSAPGGAATKERMLALEGVRIGPPPTAQASFGF